MSQFHTQKIYLRQFHTHLTHRQNHTHTRCRVHRHIPFLYILYVQARTPYCMYLYVLNSTRLVHVHTVLHIVNSVFAVFAVFAVSLQCSCSDDSNATTGFGGSC
eukprot:COSAG02_NODE_1333_length_13206_cov_221.257801_3_plen_104_part_00